MDVDTFSLSLLKMRLDFQLVTMLTRSGRVDLAHATPEKLDAARDQCFVVGHSRANLRGPKVYAYDYGRIAVRNLSRSGGSQRTGRSRHDECLSTWIWTLIE